MALNILKNPRKLLTLHDGCTWNKAGKKCGHSPYVGGLIGVVAGGVLILVSQHYFYRHYHAAQHYQCLQCGQSFAVAD
jgi:hypothetical protein